jgi:hypothetical protein
MKRIGVRVMKLPALGNTMHRRSDCLLSDQCGFFGSNLFSPALRHTAPLRI